MTRDGIIAELRMRAELETGLRRQLSLEAADMLEADARAIADARGVAQAQERRAESWRKNGVAHGAAAERARIARELIHEVGKTVAQWAARQELGAHQPTLVDILYGLIKRICGSPASEKVPDPWYTEAQYTEMRALARVQALGGDA